MECFDLTVTAIDKVGQVQFTRNVQLLAEMPAHLIAALNFAAVYTPSPDDARMYLELGQLITTLFEAGE